MKDYLETVRRLRDRVNLLKSQGKGAVPDDLLLAEMETAANQLQRAAAQIEQQTQTLAKAGGNSDRFIANISHELRTPLTPALLIVSALQSDPQLPEEVRSDLAMVREQLDLEARLVDDLLDNSRLSRGRMQLRQEPIDLHALLGGIVAAKFAQEPTGPKLFVDYRATQRRVHGDPGRLRQMFSNLLQNAFKFTPPQGKIEVIVTDAEKSIVVEIKDTGRGFDPAQGPNVFEAFTHGQESLARNFGGLGLGLSIARGLATLHGGEMTASSAGIGKGASFCVTLPAIADAPVQNAADHHRLRLLLVEDDGTSRLATGRLLEMMGYIVRTAGTYAAALQILSTEKIDVILCDIELPDGSGWDLMRAAREFTPAIKGLALSGFGREEDISKSIESGFEKHLVKPFTMQGLTQAIDKAAGAVKREVRNPKTEI